MKRLLCGFVFAVVLVGRLWADDVPKLTEVQRLTLQNRILTFQLAQTQLETYVHDLQKTGYDLDLGKLDYVKKTD